MTAPHDLAPRRAARLAGLLYLVIILLGISAELALRMPLMTAADPGAAIAAAPGTLRLAMGADAVMALADAGLAVLLFLLLREKGAILALAAMVFRLVQTAVIAGNLPLLEAALAHAPGPLAGEAMARHAFGYDTGLLFFGVSSLLTGALVARFDGIARALGPLLMGAGAVYLAGSALRILAPGLVELFAPAYLLPVIAETAICVWLLAGGAWRRTPSAAAAAYPA